MLSIVYKINLSRSLEGVAQPQAILIRSHALKYELIRHDLLYYALIYVTNEQ